MLLMKRFTLLLFVLCTWQAYGQSKRRQAYDSMLVGDQITPAVSSVMMPKTYTEVLLSNALLTTNSYFTSERDLIELGQRNTYLFNVLQITHGVSRSSRFNIGLDLTYRSGRADSDPDSSPLKIFGNSSDGLIGFERGLTSVGFRTRYVPTRNRNFVIQHILTVPFSTTSADNVFLGDNRYAFNTQFLYNQLLGRKFFLFGQADALVRFTEGDEETDYTNPLYLFVTYLLNRHVFPFALIGMTNAWDSGFSLVRQSFNYGVGVQYQFNTMFNVNFFYTDIFAGKNVSRWNTYNLGLRVVL
jgi:hypothetical protein